MGGAAPSLFDRLRGQRSGRDRREGEGADPAYRSLRLITAYEQQGAGWFWESDRVGRITYLTDSVVRELAQSGISAIGEVLTTLFQVDSGTPHTQRTLGFHVNSRTGFSQYTVRPAGGDDSDRWWSISGRPLFDELGNFEGFVGWGSDLTAERRAEAEITRLAMFDALTGLANRQRMRQSLDQTLIQSASGYRPTALMLLDLDRFKMVNDTLGHQAGDQLLKQVAQRLQRSVGDAGLVGRLGGDEFQLVVPSATSRDALSTLAKDIIDSLSQPYFIHGSSVTIGCSAGIAIAPEDAQDSEMLTRNADLALYEAKAAGRGVHRFFREELLHGAQSRKQLEDDLRHALGQKQMHVVYQPVVSTRSGAITGYEALVRWTHPARGPVSPADFIPIAEECGLIEQIGEWVMRTACEEAAGWPGEVRVAVNVSPIQFANPALPAVVASALAKSGLAPERLELEITEGVFLNESAASEAMFASLKGLGVRLALDDFGTGYASFGYLRKAPLDKIKIDQSFVRGAAVPGNRNAAIIKAIVTLADVLAMETTAEGVEIQDEIALIRDLGCSHIQGYVYGKPMRAEEARALLADSPGAIEARGHKVSRAPRTTILRKVTLEIDGMRHEVRLRNVSPGGALIDGLALRGLRKDQALRITLGDGEWLDASIAWLGEGRMGISWKEAFDISRLTVPAGRRGQRHAA